MTRSTPEWIGKTPDTAVPPRVSARVFQRCGGICHISGRKIRPGDKWEMDHIVPLILGGENRETNLAPALKEKHKQKTRAEVAQKAKEARVRNKHLGLHKSKTPLPGGRNHPLKRKINGPTVNRSDDT